MSCGTPHENCREVIQQVYLYLDGELDDSSCTEIRAHLDDCAPCLREFGLEREFKELIARKCGCEEAPAALRDRVLVRLREVSVQIDAEFQAE